MDVSEAAVRESTVRLLRAIDYNVVVPEERGCCGAPHVHSGDRITARELTETNRQAFTEHNFDLVVTNAAGCSAQLKDYHHPFPKSDPEHNKDWKGLSSKIVDILELLSRHPEEVTQLSWRQDEDVVLYDAPCHLMHAQKIDANPRQLVNSLPGVKLVPLTESNWCCGSAGIYNLLQPELAGDVLKRKIDSVRATSEANPKATTLFTGNPGCLYQIRAGIREAELPLRVIHPAIYIAERLQG